MTDNRGEKPKYDLEERTACFGKAIIKFSKSVPRNPVTLPLISQLVRSGTSVGANDLEAEDAESPRDFRHEIAISRKESKEVRHWLRMVVAAEAGYRETARPLWQEAKELNLIFGALYRNRKD